ncbi:MAG: META domain-containing protein [Lactobacillales bacterium]|jgi:heat shock protein HslJ|nr:META domain-containing protein [Lactobacillales bacterium]
MKKIMTALCALLFVSACADIRGNEYQQVGSGYTIAFSKDDNKYFGQAMNRYSGTYKTDGDELTLKPVMATKMAGTPDQMQQEQNYFADLALVKTYDVSSDSLMLNLENGNQMNFTKTKSLED